jgi:hypothetical protein
MVQVIQLFIVTHPMKIFLAVMAHKVSSPCSQTLTDPGKIVVYEPEISFSERHFNTNLPHLTWCFDVIIKKAFTHSSGFLFFIRGFHE